MALRSLQRCGTPSGFMLALCAASLAGSAYAQSPPAAGDTGRAYVSGTVQPYYEGQPIPKGRLQVALRCNLPEEGTLYKVTLNTPVDKDNPPVWNDLPVGAVCQTRTRWISMDPPEGYTMRTVDREPKEFTVRAATGPGDKGQEVTVKVAVEATPIQIPVMSCTGSGTMISTGTIKATGASVPANSPDPVWEVASVNSMDEKTLVPVPADAWYRAMVVNPVRNKELEWSVINDQPGNFPTWIAPNVDRSATLRTYYRYRFKLDKDTDPEKFNIIAPIYSDNQVLAVFINGRKLDGNWGYSHIKNVSPEGVKISGYGVMNLYSGFRAGENEVILLVENTSEGATLTKAAKYSGLFLAGNNVCGEVTLKKSFSMPVVKPGGEADLTFTFTARYTPSFKRYAYNGFPLIISDDLPAPLKIAGPVKDNTCRAKVSAKAGGTHIFVRAPVKAVPDGKNGRPGECHLTVPVVWPVDAAGQCPGKATNTINPLANQRRAGVFFSINGEPTSDTLQCELHVPDLQMNKTVHLLPDVSGPFKFTYTAACSLSGKTWQIVRTLTVPGENKVVFPSIEGGSHCSISEAMPPAPAGYEWSKPPEGSWPIIVNIPAKGEPSPVNAPETWLKKAEPPPPPSPSSAHRIPVDNPLALLALGLGMAGAGGGAFWLRGRKHADRE